jgi:hypothetical protein
MKRTAARRDKKLNTMLFRNVKKKLFVQRRSFPVVESKFKLRKRYDENA